MEKRMEKRTSLVDKYIETALRLTRAQNIKDYFTSLSDAEAVALLVKFEKYSPKAAKEHLAKIRELTKKECDWTKGPVATLDRRGFTLKKHAPLFGPCRENWRDLQSVTLQNDEPTKDSIIFGVPRLLFTDKTVDEELTLLDQLGKDYGLSERFFSLRGAAEQAGLILNHYNFSGERTPQGCKLVRTATCGSDGHRLGLGDFGDGGLFCGRWYWGGGGGPGVGVFALGVVELGQ